MSHGVVPARAARATRSGLAPFARMLHSAGVSANAMTAVGLALTAAGAALLAIERPLPAFVVLLLGSLADTLDGAIARADAGGTALGAFLDSTSDRVADGLIFGATALVASARADVVLLAAALVALAASSLVSYARAKAESLGFSAHVGLAPREARLLIVLVGLGAWGAGAPYSVFVAAVVAVALLSTLTATQRVAVIATGLRDIDQRSGSSERASGFAGASESSERERGGPKATPEGKE